MITDQGGLASWPRHGPKEAERMRDVGIGEVETGVREEIRLDGGPIPKVRRGLQNQWDRARAISHVSLTPGVGDAVTLAVY